MQAEHFLRWRRKNKKVKPNDIDRSQERYRPLICPI
jgi:hypothetical protein